MVGFLAVALLVSLLMHLYLWKRLVRDTMPPGRARRLAGTGLLALMLLVPGTLIAARAGAAWLAWPGHLWLALAFYGIVALLALELPLLLAGLWLRRRGRPGGPVGGASPAGTAHGPAADAPRPADGGGRADPPPAATTLPELTRRRLLARSAAIVAGLAATGVTGYGVRTAFGPPQLDRVQIPLAKLPRRMDGFRVALVSDIHLGPLLGRGHTARIVDAINGLSPDLVAVVGDLVDGTVAELGPAAAPLARLRARHGSFFVTGNHEYYSGVQEWVQELPRLGLRVLANERTEIDALDLAGVNDLTGTQLGVAGPDLPGALRGRDPGKPVVLLAHQPVVALEAAEHGVDLQLSGHTHGGQMVPFNLVVGLQQPVVSGLGRVGDTAVYVTNGAGFWGPPVRVGAPPQVTLVELRAR
ncbi:MAG TPA: metallophosphoesterase [Pilimelia sp.]|nr:metallophosphoesterase [Pilimelia sp.]